MEIEGKIEGEPTKKFRVFYCDINDEPHALEAEYDTLEELQAHRWRLDRRHRIQMGRVFYTRTELKAKLDSQIG